MKVILFDYWTKGFFNFIDIANNLKKDGHEVIFLHIGSFRFEHPKQEIINGFKVRDISYYKTNLIHKMLEAEGGDVLLSLNTTHILDRSVVLSARKLGIKTVFMMHGSVSLYEKKEELELYIKTTNNIKNKFISKIKKIPKYAYTMIPNYLYSLYKFSPKKFFKFKFINVIWYYYKNPVFSSYYPNGSDELVHDLCLIYAENERAYYNNLGYVDHQIEVSGNPKLSNCLRLLNSKGYTIDMLPAKVHNIVSNSRSYVLYLDEALCEAGNISGISAQDRVNHINEIAKKLWENKIHLVVKLHPSSNINLFHGIDSKIILERNFLDELVHYSKACIGHITTTIKNVVLHGKPLIHTNWGKYNGLSKYWVDYGISNLWNSPLDEINLHINNKKRQDFIDYCISTRDSNIHQSICDYIVN